MQPRIAEMQEDEDDLNEFLNEPEDGQIERTNAISGTNS